MDVLMSLVLYCSLYNKGITVINGDKSKKIMNSLNIYCYIVLNNSLIVIVI